MALVGDSAKPDDGVTIAAAGGFLGKLTPLAGIVGFELRVTDLQCKIKLNQHRPEAHAAMRAAYAAGNERERALGEWMDRLGIGAAPGAADGG